MKIILALVMLATSFQALSVAAWYKGTINRIWPNEQSGGFIITYENERTPSELSDCRHGYAYFRSVEHQPERLRAQFALALSAFHSGSKVGIIIDKAQNGDLCHAAGLDIRKAQ